MITCPGSVITDVILLMQMEILGYIIPATSRHFMVYDWLHCIHVSPELTPIHLSDISKSENGGDIASKRPPTSAYLIHRRKRIAVFSWSTTQSPNEIPYIQVQALGGDQKELITYASDFAKTFSGRFSKNPPIDRNWITVSYRSRPNDPPDKLYAFQTVQETLQTWPWTDCEGDQCEIRSCLRLLSAIASTISNNLNEKELSQFLTENPDFYTHSEFDVLQQTLDHVSPGKSPLPPEEAG